MDAINFKDNEKVINDFRHLCKIAFPFFERGFVSFLVHKIKRNKKLDLICYYEDNSFVGFSLTTTIQNHVELIFLAVNPTIQSHGYGSKIISYLKFLFRNKSIFLLYESLEKTAKNYEQRVKRAEFYKKNGFVKANIKVREFFNNMDIVQTNNNPINIEICQKAVSMFWPLFICKLFVYEIKIK